MGRKRACYFRPLLRFAFRKKAVPVGVMLSEHEQGRKYIKEMDRAVASGPDYKAFAVAAKQYSALLQGHIQKENTVLFPMAENALDKASLDQLYESFEEHEEKVIGKGRHEELHKMLDELKTRYLK